MADAPVMDRLLSLGLFGIAIVSIGGAGLMLLNGFIEYLQSGSWTATSVLQFGYDTYVVRARWFLANDWSWWIHDMLGAVPLYAALLGIAPIAWWLSNRFSER
jgi:hypothetical protein